ncbi:MAG: hypothetical protein AWM53_01881 [Candidatus Dichloromethanomonas elyunquensis]|nr:MAG: hypothetical protein AWM53_01881 [Candidatus Dichloromethanomonas elyunquensis]
MLKRILIQITPKMQLKMNKNAQMVLDQQKLNKAICFFKLDRILGNMTGSFKN